MRSFDHLKADQEKRVPALFGPMADEPKFHFNRRLNACLMQVEFWSLLGGTKQVINVYENTVLLSAGETEKGKDGKPEIFGERDGQPDQNIYYQFDERAKKLMTE